MKDLINDNDERQKELEQSMAVIGVQRYYKNVDRTPLPDTVPGRTLLGNTMPALTQAIEQFRADCESGRAGVRHTAYSLIQGVDAEILAHITIRAVLTKMVTNPKVQAMCLGVGFAVRDHLRMRDFADQQPGLFKHTENKIAKSNHEGYRQTILRRALKLTDVVGPSWDTKDQLRVGEKLIDLLIQCTTPPLIEAVTVREKGRSTHLIRPTEAASRWLHNAHSRCELWEPFAMPMIVPPVDWTGPLDGGYLTFHRPIISGLSRRRDADQLLDELHATDMPQVYDALNRIQSVGWRVNRPIFDLMRKVWDEGGNFGGLPPRENTPLPPITWDKDETPDPEALRRWKATASSVHEENGRSVSKRLAMQEKINTAEKFAGESAIYFPHQLDFRGRVYPISGVLSPQGDDTSKALLQFANGERLGEDGAYWLAVHIANLFGEDKISLDDRVRWTMQQEENIIASAANPLDHEWWTQADYPWMALAAIFEYAGFLVEGEDFVSHLPVALDGSCSGLQHYAAMLRNPDSARAVNLVPTEVPQDVYQEVANRVEHKLANMVEPTARVWQRKVSRRLVKRPCMTYAYSVTRFGIVDQLMDELRRIDSELPAPYLGAEAVNHAASLFLAPILLDTIAEVVESAAHGMAWLRSVCKVASKDGLSVRWHTPTGFPVVQPYRVWSKQRYEIHFAGKRRRVVICTDTDKVDGRRQTNGIAPNYVHSMDASHLMMTVNSCYDEGITSLAVIHDSFGTHAGRTSELFALLRQEFAKLYQGDALYELYVELFNTLPAELANELPHPPEQGAFDPNEVIEADFCFS
jgi:DNA-directed RNA polymerase